MEKIENRTFEGERPLFAQENLLLEKVSIGLGESALKRTTGIIARDCTFNGKYPFWHSRDFTIDDCLFLTGARAALWYSEGCLMNRCRVEAPKMFRRMRDIEVNDTVFTDGQQMLWDCDRVKLRNVQIDNCDNLFMHTDNIDIDGYRQNGNYTFQYCRNVIVRNAVINSKDAFWDTENVTVYDSEINGEYLGWYSRNLKFVNCRISGTQPFCYIKGLTLINCILAEDCDLAFEESDVLADVVSDITSIKNPHHGEIKARKIGEIIMDEHRLPDSDCRIVTTD